MSVSPSAAVPPSRPSPHVFHRIVRVLQRAAQRVRGAGDSRPRPDPDGREPSDGRESSDGREPSDENPPEWFRPRMSPPAVQAAREAELGGLRRVHRATGRVERAAPFALWFVLAACVPLGAVLNGDPTVFHMVVSIPSGFVALFMLFFVIGMAGEKLPRTPGTRIGVYAGGIVIDHGHRAFALRWEEYGLVQALAGTQLVHVITWESDGENLVELANGFTGSDRLLNALAARDPGPDPLRRWVGRRSLAAGGMAVSLLAGAGAAAWSLTAPPVEPEPGPLADQEPGPSSEPSPVLPEWPEHEEGLCDGQLAGFADAAPYEGGGIHPLGFATRQESGGDWSAEPVVGSLSALESEWDGLPAERELLACVTIVSSESVDCGEYLEEQYPLGPEWAPEVPIPEFTPDFPEFTPDFREAPASAMAPRSGAGERTLNVRIRPHTFEIVVYTVRDRREVFSGSVAHDGECPETIDNTQDRPTTFTEPVHPSEEQVEELLGELREGAAVEDGKGGSGESGGSDGTGGDGGDGD